MGRRSGFAGGEIEMRERKGNGLGTGRTGMSSFLEIFLSQIKGAGNIMPLTSEEAKPIQRLFSVNFLSSRSCRFGMPTDASRDFLASTFYSFYRQFSILDPADLKCRRPRASHLTKSSHESRPKTQKKLYTFQFNFPTASQRMGMTGV
jgi:hypothetical protein